MIENFRFTIFDNHSKLLNIRTHPSILILCFFLFIPLVGAAQKHADQEFYLIDSLDFEQLSEYDKKLIDSLLIQYHQTNSDSLKMKSLEDIVDNCWDPEVWPKYNDFLIGFIQRKLVFNHSKSERDLFIRFLAGAISNKGFLLDEQGDFMGALDYYHQSLKFYESVSDTVGIGVSFNNLGVLYSVIGDTAKALEYHEKSLYMKKEVNDLEGIAMSYNNIGTIYENKKNSFLALDYYEKSLDIWQELGLSRGLAITYENIGDIYFIEEFYGKALFYYNKAAAIWIDLNVVSGISNANNNLAMVYAKTGQLDKALEYGLRSYKVASELDFPLDIENATRTLVDIYKAKKDYKSAFKYSEIYISARDRIRNNQNTQAAMKKSVQYEYQKMALADSLEHVRQNEIRDVEMRRQKTQSYALYAGIGLMLVLSIVSIRSYQRKKKDNLQINQQKKEVEIQKAEIEKQHVVLANTHQEISASISYAQRIQEAILPSDEWINQIGKDIFIYYRPKDVVSGDFYWIEENKDKLFIAAADCTGHGVPGAMVSVVCSNALNRAVREFKLLAPADVLSKTRELVLDTFNAENKEVKDGMDISLISIDKNTGQIEWAGAFNPLYIFRNNGDFDEITADKQPVGKFHKSEPFTNHKLRVEKGDILYLFTDGFLDQFGGPNGKKYKYGPFKKFLGQIYKLPLQNQKKQLNDEFDRWRGNLDQIDDVCVIGVRI